MMSDGQLDKADMDGSAVIRQASIHVLGATMEQVRRCVGRVKHDREEGLNPFDAELDRCRAKWEPRETELREAVAEWGARLSRGKDSDAPEILIQQSAEFAAAENPQRYPHSFAFLQSGRWTSVFSEYLEQGYSRTREHAAHWFARRWWNATFFEQAVVSLEYLHDPECGFLDLAVIRSGTIVTSLSRGPGLAEVGLVESALDEEVVREVLGIAGSGGLTPHGSESLGDTCDRLAVYLGIPLLRLTAADVLADAARLHPTEDVYDA